MVSTLPSATGPADHRVALIVGAHYSYSDVPAQYTWSTCASHHFMSDHVRASSSLRDHVGFCTRHTYGRSERVGHGYVICLGRDYLF